MRRLLALVAVAVAAVCLSAPALGRPRRPRVRYEDPRQKRPSAEYAAMGKARCLKELRARKIGFAAVGKAKGVLAPVRLTGAVGGVLFRVEAPAAERDRSPAGVFDCRLVLALSDWSKALVARGIDEVTIASAWRPPGRSWPAGRPAKRHPGGLAVDVKRFGKKAGPGDKDRRWLVVARDFGGKIGEPVCGRRASRPRAAAAKELRAIVCEAHDRKVFTSILTPHYDRAHRDHLHLEITPGVTWSLLL